ncbi:MAG: ParB/RepB/Spo0J family partition protein [Clostridia bacterium]|nr:ParB/RepB/Spo0J family partition protein [Clostridia bacterium]
MAKKPGGLGRDFYAILDDNITEMKEGTTTTLRISEIEPRADQPRKQFDREALETLADSIAAYGVLQPILVRPNANFEGTFEIIAGERRWRAAKMAGLTEIPAVVVDGDDVKAAQIAIIENVQREDLNVVEEAFAYQALMDRFDMTQEQVSQQVGKSRSAIANILRLLDLPEEVLDMLKENEISAGHARALLGLKNEELIPVLARRIVSKQLSVREVEAIIRRENVDPMPDLPDISGGAQSRAWMKDLERRTRESLGRKVKITQNDKKKSIELFYDDNEDMEALLTLLCGKDFFNED